MSAQTASQEDRNDEFLACARYGELDEMLAELDGGADVAARGPGGQTALHMARIRVATARVEGRPSVAASRDVERQYFGRRQPWPDSQLNHETRVEEQPISSSRDRPAPTATRPS